MPKKQTRFPGRKTSDRLDSNLDLKRSYRVVVKWYCPIKGYGFVRVRQHSRDVFLHVAVLRKAGLEVVENGEKFNAILSHGEKDGQLRVAVVFKTPEVALENKTDVVETLDIIAIEPEIIDSLSDRAVETSIHVNG